MRLVLAVLAICAVVVLADSLTSARESPPHCMDAETRELARKLVLDGFDSALKDHSKKIFDIWMRDGQDDPSRAATGMRNGINAYDRARAAILQWQPPACKGDRQ